MGKDEVDYGEFSATRTYSMKIKNIKKIDDLSESEKIDKSKAINKIVEEYN